MLSPNRFRIRCSAINEIMAPMGLSEAQLLKLTELQNRTKALTANMEKELADLQYKEANPSLPAGCITYLKRWYANDREDIYSKYMEKGNYVESDNIDLAAKVLGYGVLEKNTQIFSNEWMTGEPDSLAHDAVIETKAAWNKTTLFEAATSPIDKGYLAQCQGYMALTLRDKAFLFYGLQDTPEEAGGFEVQFDLEESKRWFAHEIKFDSLYIQEVYKRVELCRVWLTGYDALINQALGCVR